MLTVFQSLLIRGVGWGVGGVVPGVYLPGPGGACLVWGVYLPGLGVYLPGLGGVPAWSGGVCSRRCLPGAGGGSWLGIPPPWTEFLTHACENITLAKTSFRLVIIIPY